MTRFLSQILCVVMLVAACGGAQTDGGTTPDTAPVGEAGRQVFADNEPISLEGLRFVPEALGHPGMPKVTADRKVSVPALKKKMAKKHTQIEAQIVVSSMWYDPKNPEASQKEATEIIRKEAQDLGEKADAVTLQMLGAAEASAGNYDAWMKAYETLIARFPTDEGVNAWKGWLAYLYLRADRDADAAKLVEGWTEKSGPIAAYSLAWIKFRQRDYAGATEWITTAANNWNWSAGFAGALKRDLLLMHARAGAPVEKIDAIIQKLAPAEVRGDVLFELSEGYRFAGHYERARETLELIIAKVSPGDKLPRENYVPFRFRQSDYAARMDQPAQAAEYAIQSHQGLKGCDKCSAAVAGKVLENLTNLAVFFHTTYHSTLDSKYYEPAIKLYSYVIELGGEKAGETKGNLESLKETKNRANPANGKHDRRNLYNMMLLRREAAAACYEAVVMREAELAGSAKLTLIISNKGEVAEASADPAPGQSGMGAVTQCLIERAKGWSFPAQSSSGSTAMTVNYNFKTRPAK